MKVLVTGGTGFLGSLDVESTAFASGTAALQNLIGGNADVVEGSFEHTLRMQTKGQHLMCIAVFGRYPANVLVVRKSQADKIRTIADLKARRPASRRRARRTISSPASCNVPA